MDLAVHRKLADMLGIEWRGRPVSGFDVTVRPGDLGRVTVHFTATGDQIQARSGRRQREAIEAPAAEAPRFDLDRMCASARKRVRQAIEINAEVALQAIRGRQTVSDRYATLMDPCEYDTYSTLWATEQ